MSRPRKPEPQPGQVGVLVPLADPQVAVQRKRGLVPVGQGAFAAALAQHQQHVQVLVEVAEGAAHQLVPAGAGVEQQHDERGVPAGLEALALACLEQPAQAVWGNHRHRLLGLERRAHLGHRVGDVLFLLQPAVQHAQDLVAGRRGRGGAAGEQVGEEVLKVGAGGVAQAHATGAQERLDLMEVLQVVAHGPLRAVGGAQVALEGAEEPVRRLLVHARNVAK